MSGSGGSTFFYGEKDVKSILERIKAGEELEKKQRYEGEVNAFLKGQLSNINTRDDEKINDYLNEIANIVKDEIEESVALRFGGSVSKHTYVDGLSDVDVLMMINKSELSSLSPEEVKEYLYNIISNSIGKDRVRKGDLAITIRFDDVEIQVLPAIQKDKDYKISSEDGQKWTLIKPKEFVSHLTKCNEELGSKLVPTIKLAKSIMSQLPKSKRLQGYHTEALAIEVFKNFSGGTNYKNLIMYFFENAATRVLKPIRDKSGQSIHVDSYLGKENSDERKKVSFAIYNIYRKMRQAEEANQLEYWKDIL